MSQEKEFRSVLDSYYPACKVSRAEHLFGAGGFSGALFWKLETSLGTLCLRRWPAKYPDQERLQFLHDILLHVYNQGFKLIPHLIRSKEGNTSVSYAGHLWELATWLPGNADYHDVPSKAKLSSAMKALAEFHLAANSFNKKDLVNETFPSPGITQRYKQLLHLIENHFQVISRSIGDVVWPEFESISRRLLELFPQVAPFVSKILHESQELKVPLQPAIRDIWHDHLLFTSEDVSGIVDFGALNIESVAGDVARLLGSLVGDNIEDWDYGLKAYHAVRPLNDIEMSLVYCFDKSTVLMSGMNWMNWVYVQGRYFENQSKIISRMKEIMQRLEHLAETRR